MDLIKVKTAFYLRWRRELLLNHEMFSTTLIIYSAILLHGAFRSHFYHFTSAFQVRSLHLLEWPALKLGSWRFTYWDRSWLSFARWLEAKAVQVCIRAIVVIFHYIFNGVLRLQSWVADLSCYVWRILWKVNFLQVLTYSRLLSRIYSLRSLCSFLRRWFTWHNSWSEGGLRSFSQRCIKLRRVRIYIHCASCHHTCSSF